MPKVESNWPEHRPEAPVAEANWSEPEPAPGPVAKAPAMRIHG
jgi:hypothetical protein